LHPQCGWHIEPGDVTGPIRLLETLDRRRDLIVEAGTRARKAFEQNYDRLIGVARIARVLGLEQPQLDRTQIVAAGYS
jgi:hypothetical protein